jgi:Divergent InlB B-repeat domain
MLRIISKLLFVIVCASSSVLVDRADSALAADITLSWADNSNNESGFQIQRKTGSGGTFAQIATVSSNAHSYVDAGLAASTTFCYRVRAFNAAGNSAFTPDECKTTPSGSTGGGGTGGNIITLQAESGTRTAPMVVRSHSGAQGGRYVEVPEGSGNNFNDNTRGGPGQVRFSINISQAGTRALWARTIAPNSNSDSFYVRRNGSLVREWTVPTSTTWRWNKVTNLSLSSGTVQIDFRQRDDGTKLDAILLSTDLNYNPGATSSSVAATSSSTTLALAAADTNPSTTADLTAQGTLSINVITALTNNGSGSGTVTSAPAGINCGIDCTEAYIRGTQVTLIATPASGSTFSGWSGNAECKDGVVLLNADVACTATFSSQALGLNVSKTGHGNGAVKSAPSGINCGADCSEAFASGTTVKLTAVADTGSTFRGWSREECGRSNSCTVVVSGSTSVTAFFEPVTAAKIGVYRPRTGEFLLDRDGNGKWDGCAVDTCFKWLAQSSGLPVAGSWDGGHSSQIGTFDSANGRWYLDRNGNGKWDGCAVDQCITNFGTPGDLPVVRHMKDVDHPTIGIFRGALVTAMKDLTDRSVWQFDTNGNFRYDGCEVDTCLSKFGNPGDIAVVGDWDGSGGDKLAFYSPVVSRWRLDYDGNGTWEGCSEDKCFPGFGQPHDIPVAGDWDGTGKARIGVFRPSTGEWFLDKNGNGRLDACTVDVCIASFGEASDRPVAGNW